MRRAAIVGGAEHVNTAILVTPRVTASASIGAVSSSPRPTYRRTRITAKVRGRMVAT